MILENGDIVKIESTVNGENKFIILRTNPLDIRYESDIKRLYEYDKDELIAPCKFSGEESVEIVGNIFK